MLYDVPSEYWRLVHINIQYQQLIIFEISKPHGVFNVSFFLYSFYVDNLYIFLGLQSMFSVDWKKLISLVIRLH